MAKTKISKEQVTSILENFGFKVYSANKKQYFLQSRAKIKPMTKYSMEYMLDLFNKALGVEEKVEEPAMETSKPKPKTKKVKKDE